MAEVLPAFVIVGAQKAGSTNLAATLAQHPAVYMPDDEVPYFEAPYFENSSPVELTRALAPGRGRLTGIKRPDYLSRRECAPNLAAVVPDAKILVCVRDPVDRALSAYYWYLKTSKLPLEPPEVGLARLLDGSEPPGHPHAGEVLEYGRYATHLRRYYEHFPPEQVHVSIYEDLRVEPSAFDDVHGFLGLAPSSEARDRGRNPGVYEMRRLRWLRRAERYRFRWEDEVRYTWRRRRLRRPMSFVVHGTFVAVDRVVLARLYGNERPRVDPALLERLREYYRPEVADLAGLLGRDLSEWQSVRAG